MAADTHCLAAALFSDLCFVFCDRIIRNSWAEVWGEKGYIRLSRGNNCNGVATHVSSALFAERSLCLAKCAAGDSCCGGDCCPKDSATAKCCTDGQGKPTGCCEAPAACCGASGGGSCCEKAEYCCGGMCCDPKYGKCSPDGTKCCPHSAMCGEQCCPAKVLGKCCKNMEDPSKSTCPSDITSTCCMDGSSCPIGKNCCHGSDGSATCCGFMDYCDNGKCKSNRGSKDAFFARAK